MSVYGRHFPIPFLVTTEVPCPYLPDRQERKIITELSGGNAPELFELLSHAGFRRSHGIAYRPACAGCQACVPVRIPVAEFQLSRWHRRVWRRNSDLAASVCENLPTHEQYDLFATYLEARHSDGEMVGMGPQDYSSMVADSPVDTRLIEFRSDGLLTACCLTDWGADGISAVYSFFQPSRAADSLGSYIILWLIEEALRHQLPYVYLGYWVAGSRKMAYKARFQPLEAYGPGGWTQLPASAL
ncbi:MAG TPA: arginyltransferase [Terriglobia bacterium]|nr:arginyltransferase [Terriglobia bacterium]